MTVKILMLVALQASLLVAAPLRAEVVSCDAIKEKIVAKLDGKGVKNYTLKVVGKDEESGLRIVGQCEGGKKKILYQRGKKSAEKKADAE